MTCNNKDFYLIAPASPFVYVAQMTQILKNHFTKMRQKCSSTVYSEDT